MQKFLFVVDMPAPGMSSEDPGAASRWFAFAPKADALPLPRGGSKMPCRNLWLLPVELGGECLHKLQSLAQENQLGHSTFLISGEVTNMNAVPVKPNP